MQFLVACAQKIQVLTACSCSESLWGTFVERLHLLCHGLKLGSCGRLGCPCAVLLCQVKGLWYRQFLGRWGGRNLKTGHKQLHYAVGTIPMVCMNMKKNDKAGISPVSQFIAFTVLFNPLFHNVLQMAGRKQQYYYTISRLKNAASWLRLFVIVKDLMALQFTGLG